MKLPKFINEFLGYYIAIVITFSIAYYGIFWCEPFSFIIKEELNINPIDDALKYDTKILDTGLLDLISITDSVRSNQRLLDHKLDQISYSDSIMSRKIDSLYDQNTRRREVNIDKFQNDKENSSINLKKKEQLIKKRDSLRNYRSLDRIEMIDNTISMATIKVELAKIEVRISEDKLNTLNFIMANLNHFNDQRTIEEIYVLENKQELLKTELYRSEKSIDSLKTSIKQLLDRYIEEQRKRLSWGDFIFFSASNSSTVTYGELIPNNGVIRSLIMIQVLLSLIVFGGYIDKLYPQKEKIITVKTIRQTKSKKRRIKHRNRRKN